MCFATWPVSATAPDEKVMRKLCALTLLLCLAVLALAQQGTAASGDQPAKHPTIGVVWFTNASVAAPYDRAFRTGLRELGYVDGNNLSIVARYSGGDYVRQHQILQELIGQRVDMLVVSPKGAQDAKEATSAIPIVCPSMGDPVESGLIANIARPGGNLTGLYSQFRETAPKRLELAQELLPHLRRVAVLFDSDLTSEATVAKELSAVAHLEGLTVKAVGARNTRELASALESIAKDRPQALIVTDTPFIELH